MCQPGILWGILGLGSSWTLNFALGLGTEESLWGTLGAGHCPRALHELAGNCWALQVFLGDTLGGDGRGEDGLGFRV